MKCLHCNETLCELEADCFDGLCGKCNLKCEIAFAEAVKDLEEQSLKWKELENARLD